MKRLRFIAAAMLVLGCGNQPVESADQGTTTAKAAQNAPLPPKIGDLAPDFTLADQSGTQVTLSGARGQKVILVFYRGHW